MSHHHTFEIILYIQEHYQHLFSHKDVDGQMVVDEERLKSFAAFLRDQLDRDHDGLISREEFIKGYCIWQVYIGLNPTPYTLLPKPALVSSPGKKLIKGYCIWQV